MNDDVRAIAKRITNTAIDINTNAENPAFICLTVGVYIYMTIYPNGKNELPDGQLRESISLFACENPVKGIETECTYDEMFKELIKYT